MPSLNGLSGLTVVRTLQNCGFTWVRTKGSHAVLRNNSRVCVVPLHDEIAVGTLRGVLRQAGITAKEFLDNM